MLHLHEQARLEFIQASLYYRNRTPLTAQRFIDEVEKSLRLIAEFPLRYQIYRAKYRRKAIPKFPYGIFYRQSGNDVYVIAIYHTSRRPDRWMKRDR